jgi:hypothetical protein
VALVVVLVGARIWIALGYGVTSLEESSFAESIVLLLAFAMYLVMGLLIVARRPENRLGWVLTAIGLLTCAGVLSESYALLALADRPEASLPGAVFAAWIHNWYWFPLLVLMILFVPMLFPDGRPASPRWNWLYRSAAVMLVVITFLGWAKPTLTDGSLDAPRYVVDNPIGISALGDIEESLVGTVAFAVVLGLAVCAIVSLVLRFRRSRGIERQQMKMFVFAGALTVALPVIDAVGLSRFLPESNALFAIAISLPPLAVGVAVLRYRLYEIDRLISRTLTYALLTAVLLALYLAAVTALTAVTAPITKESPVAVAAATLLAAAAFGPARRRIQRIVDRRFNRGSYDAARTLEQFRAHLRDELDLESISTSVQTAMNGTVEPARSLVWLRDAPGGQA